MYLMDTLFKDLRMVMSSVVVKYDRIAKKNETVDTLRESDLYVSAMNQQDSFHTYQKFDIDAIRNAGITDPILISEYRDDKNKIPKDKRNRVVEEQRKLIIANYVEKNDYYRMLAGLPNMGDMDFVYVDVETCADLGLNPTKPIHEYTLEDIAKLNKINYLSTLAANNPEKKYLQYLGDKKIDIVRARTARPFAILNMTKSISESFYADFNNVYEQCREYYMTVIYNSGYANSYELYDNFIAMMIMVMTIQRLITNTFKYGIDRDFYDLSSIKMLFEAYSIPFIQSLPLDYQRILVRNLNRLLRYKSTDKVLYDICSLLGYDRIKLFKYFLIKEHRMDVNENPVFIYKEVANEDGTTTFVEDYEQMYNLYFQSVELKERNPALALANSTTKLDYEQVVVEDPYWWDDDEELKRTIYESEFNYVETKFLSMNIMYKLTEMLFEVIYVFRMIIEKKNELGNIELELPKLFDTKKINLFDIIVLLCALISKKNGMVGNIIFTPSKTLSVLGFNFSADFDTIKKYIRDNSKLLDQQILMYLQDLRIYGPEDVNQLFVNIRALNDFIVAKLGSTQNLDEYRAYRKLYDALMVTQHNEIMFKKSDGTIAQTFLEYLDDKDAILAEFVRNAEVELISEYIDHLLAALNNFMSDLKYLYILNDSNNIVMTAITTLTRFFKSYTTDLTSFNILYLMDSRYWNMIKLLHSINAMHKNFDHTDISMLQQYNDKIAYTVGLSEKDMYKITDLFGVHGKVTHRQILRLLYGIKSVEKTIDLADHSQQLHYNDTYSIQTGFSQTDDLSPVPKDGYHGQILHKDGQQFLERATCAVTILYKLRDLLKERVRIEKELSVQKDPLVIRDLQKFIGEILEKESLLFENEIKNISKELAPWEQMLEGYTDFPIVHTEDKQKDSHFMTDKITLIWEN